jgi:CDGSH-type Zn-finger protein
MTLPVVVKPAPYGIEVKKGEKYCWCTCGLSAQQPFCDGAHKGTGMKSLHWMAEQDETVWFCGCKRTKNPPFCDGSHNEL